MEVIIDHELRFNPPAALVEALKARVSWPNPERAQVAARGRSYHHVPAEWCALDYRPGNAQARLPRGLLAQLRAAAAEVGVPITWKPRVTWDRDAPRVPLDQLKVTLRDYQAEGVQVCADKLQGVVVLPCGCLTGDSEIVVNRAGKAFRTTLADLVHKFNGGGGWNSRIPTRIQSVDANGMRRLDEVVRAFPTGRKEVFKVTLEDGKSIKASSDHRFLTETGWKRLHELSVGDEVMVVEVGRKKKSGPDQRERGERKKYKRKSGMHHHPFATKWTSNRSRDRGCEFALVPEHRLVVEAEMNGMPLGPFIRRIKAGDVAGLKFLDPSKFDVHHIDRNTENNDRSNLEVLDSIEHQRKHGHGDNGEHCHPFAEPARIVSIVSDGVRDTFDLTMKAKEANYVANGFVVHNSGKTCTGAVILLHLNQRSVVVAPSIAIADQWVETLRRIKPDVQIREVHGSTTWTDTPLGPTEIAVGVDDSLAQPRARRILASAGVLITDETHRVASKTWQAIVTACSARWRIGLTATPERVDGWHVLLPCLLGPVLLQREQQWLVQRGYLAQPTIFPIDTGVESTGSDFVRRITCAGCKRPFPVKPEDEIKQRVGLLRCPNKVKIGKRYDVCGKPVPPLAQVEQTFNVGKAGSRVAANPDRMEKVRTICSWAMDHDRDVLVLTPRVSAVATIVKALQEVGVPAVGLTGPESRSTRTRVLGEVRRRVYRVLVATQLADEGLDLPRMDTLVNTSAGKAAGNAAQRVGRVCRPDGNMPLVFDFVDGGAAYTRQWQARRTAYRKAYGEVALPVKKPIPLRDALAQCEVKGEPGRMF